MYSLSAFSLALQELPRALAADPHNDTQLRNTVMVSGDGRLQSTGAAWLSCRAYR